ncbi:MAG: ABC transporter ATP-binding protein [Treponema sp.]|jgi:ABC-type oligopeptide transport system ATPase subunit|nr:ABC transporter ATP-binding protein [Treponema sp.]
MPPLIAVRDLRKRFNLEAGFFAPLGRYVYAVNGVSFDIGENESYGLVGESGCGKTTTARLLTRMYESGGGTILYRGGDLGALKKKDLALYREKVKYVFQDPARSLNPRMNVLDLLTSGRRWSSQWRGAREARRAAAAILEEVGLSAADLERRPAEFSGGQRQRISIARGLIMEPELLICDEVVSALDVSIQSQILNLLRDIRRRRNLSFLFIAHDLKVASWFCDRIGVMYRGELVEEAPGAELYKTAAHPYTRLLFAPSGVSGEAGDPRQGRRPYQAVREVEGAGFAPDGKSPAEHPRGSGRSAPDLRGEVTAALAETRGCAFAERCPQAEARCFAEKPAPRKAGADREVRCHHPLLPQGG